MLACTVYAALRNHWLKCALLLECSLRGCKVRCLHSGDFPECEAGGQSLQTSTSLESGPWRPGAAGHRASLFMSAGGCPEPQWGQDPSVCVDEGCEAGARPVLRGCAGARGQGLGLGGLPERCEFVFWSQPLAAWPRIPSLLWVLGQKVGVRVLEGQSPSAEPVSILVLGPGTQCPCLSFLNCKNHRIVLIQ